MVVWRRPTTTTKPVLLALLISYGHSLSPLSIFIPTLYKIYLLVQLSDVPLCIKLHSSHAHIIPYILSGFSSRFLFSHFSFLCQLSCVPYDPTNSIETLPANLHFRRQPYLYSKCWGESPFLCSILRTRNSRIVIYMKRNHARHASCIF